MKTRNEEKSKKMEVISTRKNGWEWKVECKLNAQ